MKTKHCNKCNTNKLETEFSWHHKGIDRITTCKACHSAYIKKHYAKHRDRYKTNNDIRKAKNREMIQKLKDVPCMDCGIKYPYYIMEFDHVKDKSFLVSLSLSYAPERIIAEAAKCEVVCSNCHRERTYIRTMG